MPESGAVSGSQGVAARPMVSITAYLQMRDDQIGRLNRVYEDHSARRLQEESKIAQLGLQLRQATAPTTFDESRAARLGREISERRQKIATDFLSARAKALQLLEPVQRAQLESLGTDTRFQPRTDRFYQLLLMPVEQMGRANFDSVSSVQNARNSAPRAKKRGGLGGGTATYGVHGGYGYGGPQYGVYGGYGRGPVGVNVGIGRGGPSIGIGIGGIFGGRIR